MGVIIGRFKLISIDYLIWFIAVLCYNISSKIILDDNRMNIPLIQIKFK